jgi:hypothetical protein
MQRMKNTANLHQRYRAGSCIDDSAVSISPLQKRLVRQFSMYSMYSGTIDVSFAEKMKSCIAHSISASAKHYMNDLILLAWNFEQHVKHLTISSLC